MRTTSRLDAATWAATRLLTAALLVPAVPGDLRAEALKARSADGDLVLVSAPRQASYLVRADGTRVALPLPPTAAVHAFAAAGAGWYAAAVDVVPGGRRLVVLKGSGAQAEELAAPAVRDAAELREPALLVDTGGLAGLAWIEGRAPRRQAVRAAAWFAGGWQEPVTVSPPGPGSQMALAAALLDDGTWLLAWAAFDGVDDEILWSRWSARGASAPALLAADNAVPDITPHLAATPGGALAAWSRYDGNDYRLHLSFFDGAAWSEPEIAGPKGSVYPTFHPGPAGPLLLYLQAVPRSWVVAELDDAGTVLRQAAAETRASERPLVGSVTENGVSLVWIGAGGEREVASAVGWQAVK